MKQKRNLERPFNTSEIGLKEPRSLASAGLRPPRRTRPSTSSKKAENDRKRYEEEMKGYKPSEEYLRKVNEAKAKDSKKKKKAPKDVNAPKRPLSAYFFFLADKREEVKEVNPNMANKDQVKKGFQEIVLILRRKATLLEKASSTKKR